jgi:hypothetical protein
MATFITETGVTAKYEARASVIRATIPLSHEFSEAPTVVVGITSCELATGYSAGEVRIREAKFVAPKSIIVVVELPGTGEGGSGRDLYKAAFEYAVIGSLKSTRGRAKNPARKKASRR